MAYDKKSGGCTPITAKIKRTTQGGMITQPILNMGAPVKIKSNPKKGGKQKGSEADKKTIERLSSDKYTSPAKMKGDLNKDGKMSGYEQTRQNAIDKSMSSPAKNMAARQAANESRRMAQAARKAAEKAAADKKAKELTSKEFIRNRRGRKVKNPAYQLPSTQSTGKTSTGSTESSSAKYPLNPEKIVGIGTNITPDKKGMAGKTPYSVKGGKGTIHGPKVSYDMAYKNRDMKTYGGMSKSEYIKEAKRQTKSFEATGSFDVPKRRKKQTKVSAVTPKKTVSIETKKPTASTEIKTQTKKAPKVSAKKVKQVERISSRATKTRQKGKEALAAGNVQKAARLKKRETRLKARQARKAKRAIRKANK